MAQFLLGKTVVFTFKVKTWSITKKTPPKDLALRKQLFPNVYKKGLLKDTLKAFNDLETSNKSVSSNVFWYVKYAYSESVFNVLYIEIKHKQFSSEKINNTKNAFFYLSRTPIITVSHLICDSYKSWSTSFVSLKLCGIFYFRFRFVFIKFIFFFNKKRVHLSDFKRHNSFQN